MDKQLVLFSLVSLVSTVSASLLTYTCYPNETIIVINPDPSHYIGVFANNSANQCSTVFSADYTNVTITGCGMNEDILLQLSNRSASDTILGGSGIYLTTVRCNQIDDTNRTIVEGFSPSLDLTTQDSLTPSFTVEMELRLGGTSGNGYTDGTRVTYVTVGTAVNWIIGLPSDYYAKMVQCTAYSGTSTSGTPNIQLVVNGCLQDSSLTGSFTTSDSVVVGQMRYYYTDFYPFQFYNNENIYLYCDVKVCPAIGSSNCDMTCGGKRRRQTYADTNDVIEYADDKAIIFEVGTGLSVLVLTGGASANIAGFSLATLALSLLATVTK